MNNIILKESIETTKMHLKRAKFCYNQVQKMDLTTELFNDEEKIKTIDAFIFRFIKLQDFIGYKLFKHLLEETDDYRDNMSMTDILDKLEKMEIIPSANRWADYRKIRNELTHEYPGNQEEILDGIKTSLIYFPEIENIFIEIEKKF